MSVAETKVHKDYIWHSKAWYSDSSPLEEGVTDDLVLTYRNAETAVSGELLIRWKDFADRRSPCLVAYDDGWAALAEMPDLLALMARLDDTQVPIDEFAKHLDALGFVDATERHKPAHLCHR